MTSAPDTPAVRVWAAAVTAAKLTAQLERVSGGHLRGRVAATEAARLRAALERLEVATAAAQARLRAAYDDQPR